MPLPKRWSIVQPFSPLAPEEPKFVLAAPGSVPANQSGPRLLNWLAAGSLLAVAFRPLPRAAASSFTVLNLGNTGSGSLRAAIDAANAHPGPDVVTFQAGLTGTIPLATQLIISGSIQIIGPGPGALAVSGSNIARVFYLTSTSLITTTISGLTIRNGLAPSGGGGILDVGQPLTLDHISLISNTALDQGGGLFVINGGPNQGALTLRDSLVTGNTATRGGGLALYNTPDAVLIHNVQFISNTSSFTGGGIFFYKSSGATTIEASTFTSNSAVTQGGGIFLYKSGGPALINGTTFSHNGAGLGGGISLYKSSAPTTIDGSTFSDNSATQRGGGLFLYKPNGGVTIDHSTIAGNQAGSAGGGIAFYNVTSGQQIVRRTTISGNGAPRGGGLWFGGVLQPISLENATISGNEALAGGGLYLTASTAPNVAIQNSTIVSNSASASGGGIAFGPGVSGGLTVSNTIVANTAITSSPDLSGTFVLNYDLVQVTGTATISDAGGNLFGLDPLLGPLADHSGPTQTQFPLPHSPVINAGQPNFAPPPATDQRGQPRVVDGRLDIGAVETVPGLFLPLVRR
jgi:hypothetical protein